MRNGLGQALTGLRRFEDAVAALRQAGVSYQELGDRREEASTWDHMRSALHHLRPVR